MSIQDSQGQLRDERLRAVQMIQQHTFEAQRMFQQTLAESHMRFLEASSEALRQLAALSGAGPVVIEAGPSAYRPPIAERAITEPPVVERPFAERSAAEWPPAVVASQPATNPVADYRVIPPPPVLDSPDLPIDAPPVREPEKKAPAMPVPSLDYKQLLLEVVADKTGFPVEIIDLNMEMESELGIDSIKRVEILSALQSRVPELKQVETAKLATTRTLQEIFDQMSSRIPSGSLGGSIKN